VNTELNSAKGVYVIAVTPFDEHGGLDLEATSRMVDFYAEKGADGLTILGIMGEAPKLTAEESVAFTRRVIERAGSLPVVVGVSAPGFAAMKALGSAAMDLGAAGLMVAPTPSLKTDDQIVSYYQMVADEIGVTVPLVVQDYPMTTGVQFSNAVLGRIIETVPSVAMLKHEDWPGLAKISALRVAERSGRRRVSILTGNGGLFLPEEMLRGADGSMTGFAYPEMMVDVCRLMAAGNTNAAQDHFDAYLPYVRYEQQLGLGLAARKYVLARRGAIASATLRRPGPKLSTDDIADIERLILRQEKRLKEISQ
jgi:4-hydroxy-tetrahydrodipicolinate synthase